MGKMKKDLKFFHDNSRFRHAELVSVSMNRSFQTLKQVQGDAISRLSTNTKE